jgi:predicted CoA-substrate-specific enzyme activase
MKLKGVIDSRLIGEINNNTVLGVDIGSRGAKAVLLHGGELFVAQVPTGVNMQETADELLDELLEDAGIDRDQIRYIVGTGYGRIALQFIKIPSEIVTEISCHAMGAHYLNADTRTIIDIGGQDSKTIQVDPKTGKVSKFIMNDKCAAGTGRFLEKAASLLEYTIAEIGPASLRAESQPQISSQCVVFAESEIISHRARGETREAIAAGLHYASARRIKNLVSKIPLEGDFVFTGGVSNNVGMKKALEDLIGLPIKPFNLDPVYAGALGAAVYAQRFYSEDRKLDDETDTILKADISEILKRTSDAEKLFINRTDVKKIGYLCTYTPIELLAASGAAHTRLLKCGEPEVVSRGELITKSVFCDFTKSLLGHFAEKDPLHDGLDQVVTFYTCDSMKATAEAIDNFFVPSLGYVVPRDGGREAGRKFFRQQILNFRTDLSKLTGKLVTDDEVSEQIQLYNQTRRLIRDISALRKRDNPPLSGRDFLEITKAFYNLQPEEQLVLLEDVYLRLASIPETGPAPLRLMMAGGIVADGDRRIIDMIEDEIGARIVVEDHCAGLGAFYHDTDEKIDPWQALANAYLDQAPCARQTPLSKRVDFSAELASEYRVQGVIYNYLKFCPCYGMAKHSFVRRFQDMDLPVLELASDYSQGDTGQIKTRLEAFVEVLTEKQEI